MADKKNTNKTLERTFQLLELFATEGRAMNVAEISRYMDVTRITAQTIVNTLEMYDYIEKDPETKKYTYGSKMLTLGSRYLYKYPFLIAAQRYADKLSNEKNLTINVSVLKTSGKMIYLLLRDTGSMPLMYTGACIPANVTASGKLLLAFTPEPDRSYILNSMEFAKVTPYSITDKDAFIEGLQQIRKDGYAYEKEEFTINNCCVAAPIFDISGKAIAAVSASVEKSRMETEFDDLVIDIISLARAISTELGYPAVS